MPCHNPLQAWRPRKGRQLVFNKNDGWKDRPVEIPCGQCIGCRLDRSLMWAVRISNELTLHDQASFLTLTYKDLPPNNSINKEDLQAFFQTLKVPFGTKKNPVLRLRRIRNKNSPASLPRLSFRLVP